MNKLKLLSSEVSFISNKELSLLINQSKNLKGKYVIVTNTQSQYLAYKDKKFAKFHENAYLRISDSMILAYLAKYLGMKELPNVKLGSKLMLEICSICSENNLNIGLYGETNKNILKLKRVLEEKYENIKIPYVYSPPFRELSDKEKVTIISEINEMNLDILFVSLGCPKQEKWMYENSSQLTCLTFGVGAAFTFIANPRRDISPNIHRIGLAWLVRFISNPGKFFNRYFMQGLPFVFLILISKFVRLQK